MNLKMLKHHNALMLASLALTNSNTSPGMQGHPASHPLEVLLVWLPAQLVLQDLLELQALQVVQVLLRSLQGPCRKAYTKKNPIPTPPPSLVN